MAPLIQHEEQRVLPAGATRGDELSSAASQHTGQLSVHPIPELQGPFDESILEAVGGIEGKRVVNIDAQTRRRNLLESAEYERLCGRKWPQKAGGRYHPIWKLTSQMLFGVHLLIRGLAKSETEVLRILQNHVDEVDGFLGRTTEDFLIIEVDVYTRMQYLSLPLQNLNTFDEMLEDRLFRLSMLDYNDQIEHAIQRFTASIDDSLKDIQKGKAAIKALWQYLEQAEREYTLLPGNMAALVDAMLSNAEGWSAAFSDLRRKGIKLQGALSKLSLAITEMQRRIGVASRKNLVHQNTERGSGHMPRLSSRRSFSGRFFERAKTPLEKPLPCDPIPLKTANGKQQSIEKTECRDVRRRNGPEPRVDREAEARRSSMGVSNPTKHTDEATHHVKSPSFIPGVQRSIVKRLSKAKLSQMTCADDDPDHSQKRPATAPSPRRLKSRTISMEQLKSFRYPRKEQHSSPMEPPMPLQHERPTPSQTPTRQETMKDQLLHYLKSDRVADAWENTVRKEKSVSRRVSQIKLNGPLSAFRTKPSPSPGSPGKPQTTFLGDEPKMQTTSRLQRDIEILDTYPLKPKRDDSAPRIHVLSLQMTLAQESERDENGDQVDNHHHRHNSHNHNEITWDTQSIITALPSVPPTIPEGSPKGRTFSGWRH